MTTIYYSVYDRIKNINTQNTGTILNFNNDIYQILYDNGKLVFIEYKDIELGLLIYEAKDDGTPGELLTDKVIRFTLHASDSGFIELNLNPLYLNTSKTMFFGIELLNKQIGNDFKIMTKCNDDNLKLLYLKSWNNDDWHFSNIPCSMKIDLGILMAN